MRRYKTHLPTSQQPNREKGVIITLVAVFVLFVLGAMAALSIDVTTIYTARSEAQLAADGAALAGGRVLANSGMTSDTTGALVASAEALASSVATQVAQQDLVGGSNLTAVSVAFGGTLPGNPTVTVSVQKNNLPTFFARIWGKTASTVSASATAEAYNPSAASASSSVGVTPVAPICVKPWLLPNIDPTNSPNPIFDTATGAITSTAGSLLGYTTPPAPGPTQLTLACGAPNAAYPANCTAPGLPAPAAWQYYPGNDDPTSFPHPTFSLPTCGLIPTPTNYQNSIAGCIQKPIACNSQVNIDQPAYTTRNSETADAVNCLTHSAANGGDTVTTTAPPNVPFEFVAGANNPIGGLAGSVVMISDSLVTVPVFDSSGGVPANPVTIIGFVQLFLGPQGLATPASGDMITTVINLVGCGTNAVGTPIILGNGASPVAVRLISQ